MVVLLFELVGLVELLQLGMISACGWHAIVPVAVVAV